MSKSWSRAEEKEKFSPKSKGCSVKSLKFTENLVKMVIWLSSIYLWNKIRTFGVLTHGIQNQSLEFDWLHLINNCFQMAQLGLFPEKANQVANLMFNQSTDLNFSLFDSIFCSPILLCHFCNENTRIWCGGLGYQGFLFVCFFTISSRKWIVQMTFVPHTHFTEDL